MSEPPKVVPEAFGPNLRRARLRRGVLLEDLTARTKVSRDLWEAMERNDFSQWPTGIFARSYIRDYATIVGLDPDATVEDFCRAFPQGDRRLDRVLRRHAAIVGHELDLAEQLPADVPEDRRQPRDGSQRSGATVRQDGRSLRSLIRRWTLAWLSHDRV